MARNGVIDLHAGGGGKPAGDGARWPRNTLPALITLERLCPERAVMRSFLDRFAGRAVGTIDDLVALRRDTIDGREEHDGTRAKTRGCTAEAAARAAAPFGITASASRCRRSQRCRGES